MPVFHEDVCMDCGGCVGVCPHDAIDLLEGTISFRDSCTECDLCVDVCPVAAIDPIEGDSPRLGWADGPDGASETAGAAD